MNTLSEKFSLLQTLGFKTPESVRTDRAGIRSFFNVTANKRDSLPYEIDGIVVSVDSVDIVQDMGINSEDCPRAQIALKFPARASFVIIKDIEWSFDGGSFATPVGIYDPTEISGAVCTRVSLKSPEWMEQNKIGVGSVVRVTRSGDVIPTIDTDHKDWLVSTPEKWEPKTPDTCPYCGSHTQRNGARLECANHTCYAKEANRIDYFLKALKVKGLAVASLREYTKSGVTLSDFFLPDELKTVEYKVGAALHKGTADISVTVWKKVKAQILES